MKKLFFLLALAVGLSAIISPAAAQMPPADQQYLGLVQAALANPQRADWGGLRQAYVQSSFYAPARFEALHEELESAKQQAKQEPAQSLAYKTLLKNHFANVAVHDHALRFARESKPDFLDPGLQGVILSSLVRSVIASGDGKTAATAFHVINIYEEYLVMGAVLKTAPEKKDFAEGEDGRFYDIFSYHDPASGAARQIYFDVTIPFSRRLQE